MKNLFISPPVNERHYIRCGTQFQDKMLLFSKDLVNGGIPGRYNG